MRSKRVRLSFERAQLAIVVGTLALLVLASAIWAQGSGSYELVRWTADSGGGASSGGDFRLQGTVGQPDAGTMSGGVYRLWGGFWGQPATIEHQLYLPIVLRDR